MPSSLMATNFLSVGTRTMSASPPVRFISLYRTSTASAFFSTTFFSRGTYAASAGFTFLQRERCGTLVALLGSPFSFAGNFFILFPGRFETR